MKKRNKNLQKSLTPTRTSDSFIDSILALVTDGLLVKTTFQGLLSGHALNVCAQSTEEPEGNIQRFDFELSTQAHSNPRVVQATSLPIYDHSGTEIEVAVILFQTHQRARAERLKTDFVNTAAHELCTPSPPFMAFPNCCWNKTFLKKKKNPLAYQSAV